MVIYLSSMRNISVWAAASPSFASVSAQDLSRVSPSRVFEPSLFDRSVTIAISFRISPRLNPELNSRDTTYCIILFSVLLFFPVEAFRTAMILSGAMPKSAPIFCMQRVCVSGDPARHRESHLADADEADYVFPVAGGHLPFSISAKTSLATRIASSAAAMPQ